MDLAIRADGGPDIGFGHVVRTAAVAAEVIDRGGSVTYLTETPAAVRATCSSGVRTVTLPEHAAEERDVARRWIDHHDPDVVLLDTYDADTDYQGAVRDVAEASAVILDDTRHAVCADYLINGNVYAPTLNYEWRGAEPTWCLGLEYLPIRGEIRREATDPEPFRATPERVVITMGGSDTNGITPAVCRAFDGKDHSVDVIVGPGFDDGDEIRRAIAETDASFERFEDPRNFATLIGRADLAVSAAGSTVYELLAVGTPTIAIPQAPNQEPIARALADRNAVERLEPSRIDRLPDRIEELSSDVERRRTLREHGRTLVDCLGARRIYDTLDSPVDGGRRGG